jgi:signal transduction histidine kinase/ligand-binding sensor domain-containing protein
MVRILIPLLLFFYASHLEGQYNFLKIDDTMVDDPDYISRITHTQDGFYWLGNTTSLLKFDGRTLETILFNEASNEAEPSYDVTSRMFPDGKGNLWFTSTTAIHRYDPLSRTTETYKVVKNGQPIKIDYYGCFFNIVTGNFWLRADNGLYAFSPESNSSTPLAQSIEAVSFSTEKLNDGRIKVYGSRYLHSGLEVTTVAVDESWSKHEEIPTSIRFIQTLPIGNGNLIAATGKGLLKIELQENILRETYLSPQLKDPKCLGIAKDQKTGDIWACYPDRGVFLVDPVSGEIRKSISIGIETGVFKPQFVYTDNENNLWITNKNRGLVIVKNQSHLFTLLPLPNRQTAFDMFRDSNRAIWASTSTGKLYKLPSGKNEWQDESKSLGSDNILHNARFYQLNGRWHIKSTDAIYRTNGLSDRWYRYSTDKSILPGLIQQDSTFLRISGLSIHQFKLAGNTAITIPVDGLSKLKKDFSRLDQLTDTTFLASTLSELLYTFNWGCEDTPIPHKIDTLTSTIYAFLKSSKEKIYLGTGNGLYSLTENGPELVIGRIGALNTISINALGEDNSGRIWAGSSNGLLCYEPKNGAIHRFSKLEGLPSNQFTYATPQMRPDGSMVMSTLDGVVSFFPDELLAGSPETEPYLKEVWINNLPISADSTLQAMPRLNLDQKRNSVDISIGLKGLSQRGMAGIECQLLGYDDDGFFVEAGQTVRYRKLPSGGYTFRYTAIGQNGDAGQTKELIIDIPPPFTETWTFYLLMILSAFSLVAGTYAFLLRRERTKQLRIREDQEKILTERERIATELHDDLGGDLASMVFIIDGHQYLQEQGVSSELDLSRIGDLANGAIKNMREMIWVLDNSQTTLATLAEQLLSKAREMAGAADLHLQADIAEDLPNYSLSSTQKKNILLMAKEAMQNIRKHAHASAFTLRFVVKKEASNPSLLIEIIDNGRGMTALPAADKKLNHGHGLKNLRNRAAAINGQLVITPSLPSGTKVSFSMPLSPSPK